MVGDIDRDVPDFRMGETCLGRRNLCREPLTVEDWRQVNDALMAFQFQLKLIVARARKRQEEV